MCFLVPGSGGHYFLFLIPTFSFLLLQRKDKPWIFVLSLVAVSMFGFTEYGSFTSSLLVGASENIQTGLHIASTTSTIFFFVVVVLLFYIYLNRALEDREHELKVAQALLEEAKERVEGPLLGESLPLEDSGKRSHGMPRQMGHYSSRVLAVRVMRPSLERSTTSLTVRNGLSSMCRVLFCKRADTGAYWSRCLPMPNRAHCQKVGGSVLPMVVPCISTVSASFPLPRKNN